MQTDLPQDQTQPVPIADLPPAEKTTPRRLIICRVAVVLLVVSCILTCVVLLIVYRSVLEEKYEEFVAWMKYHMHLGAFMFVIL